MGFAASVVAFGVSPDGFDESVVGWAVSAVVVSDLIEVTASVDLDALAVDDAS